MKLCLYSQDIALCIVEKMNMYVYAYAYIK